jgi:hypothetical protein
MDIIKVKQGDNTYEIPGIWCAGLIQSAAIQGHQITVTDAISFWISQTKLEETAAH